MSKESKKNTCLGCHTLRAKIRSHETVFSAPAFREGNRAGVGGIGRVAVRTPYVLHFQRRTFLQATTYNFHEIPTIYALCLSPRVLAAASGVASALPVS